MGSFSVTVKKVRRIVACLTLLFFTLGGLVRPQPCDALTLSEENELGKKILGQIREHMSLVEDMEILGYVHSVGNRVAKQVGTTPYQYHFFVMNESVPNAFAIPGGYIFIYRGLIELLTSEGELASILAHELAHIQAQHINRRMQEGRIATVAAIAGILASAFLGIGAEASQALALGSLAGAQSYQLKFSRENEEEADQLGFRYLTAAGYAPEDMSSAMRRLNEGTIRAGSNFPSYLSTHPALGERVQYLETLARKEREKEREATGKGKRSPPPTQGDFPMIQAALLAEYSNPQVALDRLTAAERRGDAAAALGLGRFYLRQGKIVEGMTYLQEAARKDSGSPFVLSTLGMAYMQQGQLQEARRVLRSALLLDPSSSMVRFRLAAALQELGYKEEALQQLSQLEELAPLFPEVDYRLGVLLGQVNQLGAAHYHLGRYYLEMHDWTLALFHYEKAKVLLKDAPEKMDEIRQAIKLCEKKRREAGWENASRTTRPSR